uniref:Uncharacterized protein n=1 Tax=Sphaerodactylus townsendi TaxID=933632 RepID=A0ACB8EFS2_9SAUR
MAGCRCHQLASLHGCRCWKLLCLSPNLPSIFETGVTNTFNGVCCSKSQNTSGAAPREVCFFNHEEGQKVTICPALNGRTGLFNGGIHYLGEWWSLFLWRFLNRGWINICWECFDCVFLHGRGLYFMALLSSSNSMILGFSNSTGSTLMNKYIGSGKVGSDKPGIKVITR